MTVAEVTEKLAIIEAAKAARRAEFKIKFMLLMLNTGREKEAAAACTDALKALEEIIKLEGNHAKA